MDPFSKVRVYPELFDEILAILELLRDGTEVDFIGCVSTKACPDFVPHSPPSCYCV